jgi:hypothetical protein
VTGRDAWANARAVNALRSGGPSLPDGLLERIEALARHTPARRHPLVPAFAAAVATGVLVIVAISPGGSTATDLARLVTRPAAQPTPDVDRRQPALLGRAFAGIDYPNWAPEFGWYADGARRDRIDGRVTDTVFYVHTHHRVAYTIVAGKPLDAPSHARRVRVGGLDIHRFRDGPRDVVMFVRGGRTCVLSGEVHDPETLVKLAAWTGAGGGSFS